jgi:uncharacterized protein YciI
MATYFFKLIPPRPTFRETMTPEERAIMNRHVAYWTARQKEGKVPAFGPVFDSSGSYGIAVVAAETEAEATDLRAGDPVVSTGLFREEIYPMHAVVEGRPALPPPPAPQPVPPEKKRAHAC